MASVDDRLLFHEELVNLLGSDHVYFQPPENLLMKYPAIVYSRTNIDNIHADNLHYLQNRGYQVIVIDYDPDSEIVDRVAEFHKARFDRHYVSNNLNHDVFTIYYK